MRRRSKVAAIFAGIIILAMIGLASYHVYTVEVPKEVRKVLDRGLEDVVEEVMPSVVHVTNRTRGVQGSGVAITKHIILTARHLARRGELFEITLSNGTKVRAKDAISSKKYDISFIRIEEDAWKGKDVKLLEDEDWKAGESQLVPASFVSMEGVELGTSVFIIGSPYGKLHFNSVSLGIISGMKRSIDAFVASQGYRNSGWGITFTTDAAGHPGNSGCPVFTMDGKVRGILVAGFSPVLIHVVPVDTVLKDLARIEILFTLNDYEVEESPAETGYEYTEELMPNYPLLPVWNEPFKDPSGEEFIRSPFNN